MVAWSHYHSQTEQEIDDFNLRLQTCICDTHSAYWLEHCYDLFFEILYNKQYYKYYVDDTRRSDLDRIAYIKCAHLNNEAFAHNLLNGSI